MHKHTQQPEQTDWESARAKSENAKRKTFKTNYNTYSEWKSVTERERENGGHVCQITLRENSQQPTAAQSVVSEANKTKSG